MICIENKKMFFRKIKIDENKIFISKINKNIAKKVIKKLKKYNINKVVCDKAIMENREFLNRLYAENIDVYNGKKLFKYIINKVYDYLRSVDIELEKKNAAILVNDNSSLNNYIIFSASNIFKSISIVTNNFKRFKKIEKDLENSGNSVNMTNNKKKSLKNVQIIINIDFPSELVNKFSINNKAILIHIEQDIKIESKKFQGVNINYYQIDFENKFNNYENYDKNAIYEGLYLEEMAPYSLSELRIKYLIGNRGKILKEEFNT